MSFLDSCIFCKIIKGAIPCHKVLETGKILAFMDVNPLSLGHILIIPKYHGERLHNIPEEYLSDILPAARRIAQVIFTEKGIAYNILQNNGKLAHQEVDHVRICMLQWRKIRLCLDLQFYRILCILEIRFPKWLEEIHKR